MSGINDPLKFLNDLEKICDEKIHDNNTDMSPKYSELQYYSKLSSILEMCKNAILKGYKKIYFDNSNNIIDKYDINNKYDILLNDISLLEFDNMIFIKPLIKEIQQEELMNFAESFKENLNKLNIENKLIFVLPYGIDVGKIKFTKN